jgi:hypothetical protein
MFVETDFSLLSDANITDIVPSHLDEVRLRLKVLQGLAIQNATENSERHITKMPLFQTTNWVTKFCFVLWLPSHINVQNCNLNTKVRT